MNCRDFETQVLDLTRDRLIDAAIREDALQHAENCVQCAARLAEERALLVGVRSVIAEMSERQTPASAENSLLAAFRKQTMASYTAPITPMPVGRRHLIGWKLVAVAAGILLVISALSVLWLRSGSRHTEPGNGSPDPAKPFVAKTPVAPRNPEPPGITQPQTPSSSPRRVRHRTRTNSDAPEVMTKFFALVGNEDDLSSLESVRLVRVELSKSVLNDIGLSIGPEKTNQPVKADVVLGPDGLARAIRFVR